MSLRFPRSSARLRAAALLVVGFGAHALFAGCSGRTSSSGEPGDDEPAEGTSQQGGSIAGASGGSSAGGQARAGKPSGGRPSHSSGGAAAPGGRPPGSAGLSSGGQPSGGRSGGTGGKGGAGGGAASGGGKGGYGGVPSGGYGGVSGSGGSLECSEFGCFRRCWFDGVGPYAEGDYFYPYSYPDPKACSRCLCQVDGTVVCDGAPCSTDCAYLENEYQGAFHEAQNCLMNAQPDPCAPRMLSEDLDCFCPVPVATNTSYFELSKARAQDWLDQGCQKPNTVCPPCPSIGSGVPYCDKDESICRYR